MLTKLDILSGIGNIKAMMPHKELIELPGWSENISDIRRFDDLPYNAKAFVHFIETELKTPISWIGVGPDRAATIQKL